MRKSAWNLTLFASAIFCAACSAPPSTDDAGTSTGGDGGQEQVDVAPDLPPRPSFDLKVVTFNAGRFFDTVCDSGNCDGDAFEHVYAPAEFDFKVQQIVDGLSKLDADAILLQEVEKRECLEALVAKMPEYSIAAFGEIGGTATLDVGIIVRDLTVVDARKHRADTTLQLSNGQTRRFARELLEVHVLKDDRRVAMFTAHFKAKRGDDPAWRLAEAEKTREIAEATAAEFPDALVVVGGDLNDDPGSPPIQAMTVNDGLTLVTDGIDPDEAWTYRFFGDELQIDHLLFTNEQAGRVKPGSASVVRDASGAYGGSDHAALEATFQIFTD